jgi:hypothetical protein
LWSLLRGVHQNASDFGHSAMIDFQRKRPTVHNSSRLRLRSARPRNPRAPMTYRDGPLRRLVRNRDNDQAGPRSRLPASHRAWKKTIFDRSAVIDPITAVAAPVIPTAPIGATIIASPPGSAPVHSPHRPTDRSPTTAPIAAPPHRRTGRDGRPGNDGHCGRCDRGRGRSFSCRWRGRGLDVRSTSWQERRRQDYQRSDNRKETLTHDILR